MANAPLTLRFGSDTSGLEGAKKGVASLATSIATNMASVAGSALAGGRAVTSTSLTIINSFQAMNRASSLLVPTLGALTLGLGVTYAAFAASAAIVNLAKERLEEYVEISENAAKGGVSAEFFQRQAKAAEADKVAIEDVTKSLEKFRSTTQAKLGGSDFDQRLTKLQEAGNFQNNSGVAAFRSASTDEARYRAAVLLITQAADQGERLAGLDLAGKFLPPAMLDRLRASSTYLADLQRSADALSATKIVSDEDVARAVSLSARLDEAQKTLAQKFKPIQDDLASLGLNYHENWVSIVETMAKGVDEAGKIYQWIKGVGDVLAEGGKAPFWDRLTAATTTAESRKAAEERYGITPIGDTSVVGNAESPEMTAARNRLRNGLLDPRAVRLAGEQSTNVAYGARKDTSKNPVDAVDKEKLDQIESLINLMTRANDVVKAELDTEGKSNVEKEKGIALARAAAAARAAGRDLTDEERSKVLQLAEAHSKLADKLKDVQQAQRAAAETTRYFGNITSDVLGDLLVDGKNASDVFNSLTKSLLKAGIQALLTGQGPLAAVLGTAPLASAGGNAVGGLFGGLGKMFGFRASGGDVQAGRAYKVGETGEELFMPGQNGRVVPIDRRSAGGGSPMSFGDTIINGSGLTQQQLAAAIAQSRIDILRRVPGIAVSSVMQQQMRTG
jgi:hypothetical protein